MKVLILGMGISGKAAASLLLLKGYEVYGVDQKPFEMEGVTPLKENEVDLSTFEFVVASPGIPPTHPLYKAAGKKIVGEVELACHFIDKKMVGITGTNGKTTVTYLVTHVLNHSGIPARALGNCGKALCAEVVDLKEEVVVAELSSYQLETLTQKKLKCGVLLNITPDHLDRYASYKDYASAKIKMKDLVTEHFIVNKKTYEEFKDLFGSYVPITYGYDLDCDYFYRNDAVYYKENIAFLMPIRYRRSFSHDVENIMAAFALCNDLGVSAKDFLCALETFEKPPHRIEFVRVKEGVTFYNDSKGTNIDAVIRAVEMMDGKVVLIAGGVDKGASYLPWAEAFADKVTCMCVIGEAAQKIENELAWAFSIVPCDSFENAIRHASLVAKEGENVLLSPGCASFDMFKDYNHRGNEFKRIVKEL